MRQVAVKQTDFNAIILKTFRYCLHKKDHFEFGVNTAREYAVCLSFRTIKDMAHDIESDKRFSKQHHPVLTDLYQYLTTLINEPRQ